MEVMDILTFVNNYEKRRSNRMMKMMKVKATVTQCEDLFDQRLF